MEEDGPINFKALRAKFQEEALLAQTKINRPAVAEKPKNLPLPAGQCTSVGSGVNTGVENKTVPRVILKDGFRAPGSKRPISFSPQPETTTPAQLANGDGTTRYSLKDQYMPLVLPVLPVKDQKMEPPAEKEHKLEPEPGKENFPHVRIKKKGLLLPFKSVKAGKVNAENGEESSYADLTNMPCSAPCELPSVEKQSVEDGASLHSDQSTPEYLSSPDISITPPTAEAHLDSDNRLISTLERAKRRFSRRQIIISTKPKSLRSPDYASREKAFPSPPKNLISICAGSLIPPPPPCLPPLACISARPFFKANNCVRTPAFEKHLTRTKAEGPSVKTAEAHPQCFPLKRPLPDLRTLGPLPAKPPRPPIVNLSYYHSHIVNDASPGQGQTSSKEQQFQHPPISNPVLDAPEFPDFENSEVETPECEVVDIAALELEALDIVGAELNTPAELHHTDCEAPQPDLSTSDPAEASESLIVQDLNLGSQNIIPLDPASFPEPINLSAFSGAPIPGHWSRSKEAAGYCFTNSRSDETDVGAAEYQSFPEETELSGHAVWNDEIQIHSGTHQQDRYYEGCDNVYEDVDDIHRFLSSQTSNKQRGGLKNPYANKHPTREEQCLQKWPRNPCKEPSSPNSADYKEQRKREKHRLEREKREQKERDKKENEMKKKFKVTGDEEPMYHAKVMVASKVRKNDLPVKSGDTVSIIRTTNCPKGKWLARDCNRKYGYISVMNVELNIKEMLELGKKAQAAGRGNNPEGDTISIGSRSSNHPVLTSSFTDDSEEWACEDETLSPSTSESHSFPHQTPSVPEVACSHISTQDTLSGPNLEIMHTQTRHEALQKLAFFFQHGKDECGTPDREGTSPNAETTNFLCAVEEPPYPEQEVDFTELELLPPPPLYADTS